MFQIILDTRLASHLVQCVNILQKDGQNSLPISGFVTQWISMLISLQETFTVHVEDWKTAINYCNQRKTIEKITAVPRIASMSSDVEIMENTNFSFK